MFLCSRILHSRCSPWLAHAIVLLGIVLGSSFWLNAAEFHAGERYSLPPGEQVSENLYAAAREVVVAGAVGGDLVGVGRSVLVQGSVAQDAALAAENVNILGRVEGDARTAGREIIVSGPVGGDLIAAGARIQVLSGAVIQGDTAVAGSSMFFAGRLARSLTVAGETVTLDGEITGPVRVRAGRLIIGANAVLSNGLTYWSQSQAEIHPSARINGEVVFHETEQGESFSRFLKTMWIGLVIAAFLALLTSAVLAFALFRTPSQVLVGHTVSEFGYDFLIGFLTLILLPVLLWVLAFTVIGIPISLLGGLVYLGFGIVAIIYAGVVFGNLIFRRSSPAQTLLTWKTVLAGVVLLFLIGLIPILGTLTYAVFTLAVFGSLFHMLWVRVRTHSA